MTTFAPPSYDELKAKALNFLKNCKRKEYRQSLQEGDLEEWLDLKVTSAQRYAENLAASGDPLEVAWHRAICSKILETEVD